MFPESHVINLEEERLAMWMRQLLLRWLRLNAVVHSSSQHLVCVGGTKGEDGGATSVFSELEGLGKH